MAIPQTFSITFRKVIQTSDQGKGNRDLSVSFASVVAKMYPDADSKGGRGNRANFEQFPMVLVAMIYPDRERGGPNNAGKVSTHFPMVERGTLALARRIVNDAPDLVTGVLDGSVMRAAPVIASGSRPTQALQLKFPTRDLPAIRLFLTPPSSLW
jgi:hypothetical protein